MIKIALVTENFLVPWYPDEIELFLGGSQECIVLFAEELAKTHSIHVFTTGETFVHETVRKGIRYTDFSLFDPVNYDIIVLFKINPNVHSPVKTVLNGITKKIIYWSSDIETDPEIKEKVCLTNYHKLRNNWPEAYVFPHGIDMGTLQLNKRNKLPNTVLYCSSHDRGLEQLLTNWKQITTHFPDLKLTITYGFKIAKQILSGLKRKIVQQDEEYVVDFCKKNKINYMASLSRNELEKLYWQSKYWILPLNEPDAELFCLNAIKAQYCGCIPIINKIGALCETVGDYVPFENFCNGKKDVIVSDNKYPLYTWEEVIKGYWERLFFC